MPILSPSGAIQFLISDLVPEVLIKCENRTNDSVRAATWLRDALIEISANPDYRDDFAELELWGPTFNLTPGTQEYAEASIAPTDPSGNILDIMIWVDYPTNQNRRKMDVSHYQKTDRFQPLRSLPVEWYRFSNTLGFNPVPDKAYQIQARGVQPHPLAATLASTTILLPQEWNEVLVWTAVQRGFMELMEYEKAAAVHQLIYGDPDNKNQPGLIFHIKRKRRKEQWRTESRLTMVKRPYMRGA